LRWRSFNRQRCKQGKGREEEDPLAIPHQCLPISGKPLN
jgi:hypothetical protein